MQEIMGLNLVMSRLVVQREPQHRSSTRQANCSPNGKVHALDPHVLSWLQERNHTRRIRILVNRFSYSQTCSCKLFCEGAQKLSPLDGQKPKRQAIAPTQTIHPLANHHKITTNSTTHPHKSSNVSQTLPSKNKNKISHPSTRFNTVASDRSAHPPPTSQARKSHRRHSGQAYRPEPATRLGKPHTTFFSLFVRLARQASLQERNEAANLHPRLSGRGAGSGMT